MTTRRRARLRRNRRTPTARLSPRRPTPPTPPGPGGRRRVVRRDVRWRWPTDDRGRWTRACCTFDPDATGPAAAIINIGGANDDGVELNIIEAWPFDGSTDKGTPFLGSFVDENEEVLVFLKDGAAMVGDEVEVTGGYYANVFYADRRPVRRHLHRPLPALSRQARWSVAARWWVRGWPTAAIRIV